MTVAYTIAKALEQVTALNSQSIDVHNPLNSKLEKRLTQFDVPQQLSVIGACDLPLGRGRRFGSGMNRWQTGLPEAGPSAVCSCRIPDSRCPFRMRRRLRPRART